MTRGRPAPELGAGRPLLLGEKGCMTEMSEPTIRLATPDDAPALLAIYEPYVRQTAITCEYEVPSVEEFAGRIERTLKRYPYLVMELDERPVGYAYVSPLNSREAYDWSVAMCAMAGWVASCTMRSSNAWSRWASPTCAPSSPCRTTRTTST